MLVGTVALIGRPNTGKSTLINNLVGQKVAITSPKPQTTRFPLYAVYEDEEHQIIFVDTPGIFSHSGKGTFNYETESVLNTKMDVILYIVDHTRQRGVEENKVLGMLRKVDTPKILVINKIDVKLPSYIEQYKFMEDEFDKTVEVSAIKTKHLTTLVHEIVSYLHEGEKQVERADMPIAAMDITAKQYIEENIREKAYLRLRDEVPYKIRVRVEEITERDNGVMYIKARIITTTPTYKKMIIGAGGRKIKEIGSMARKELEISTGKKIYLELTVEVEEG